jgi:hypothetical protein
VTVTHPFHPAFGEQFVFAGIRHNWAEAPRVLVLDEHGDQTRYSSPAAELSCPSSGLGRMLPAISLSLDSYTRHIPTTVGINVGIEYGVTDVEDLQAHYQD